MQFDSMMEQEEKEDGLSRSWFASRSPSPAALPLSPSAFTNFDSPNSSNSKSRQSSPSPPPAAAASPSAALQALEFNFLHADSAAIVQRLQQAAEAAAAAAARRQHDAAASSSRLEASAAAAASPDDSRLQERERRALRRRLKHQKLDVQRRQRESAAVNALQQLTQQRLSNPQHVEDEEKCGTAAVMASAGGGVGSKVSVLEAAVERLQQLQRLFHTACETNEVKDREIARLQQRLQHLQPAERGAEEETALVSRCACYRPTSAASGAISATVDCDAASTFSFMSRLDASAALRVYIRPLVSQLLVSVPEYRVVDVNAQHETGSGWRSSAILNTLIAWSHSTQLDRSDVCPLLKKVERDHSGALRCSKVRQYPSSSLQFRQLLRGDRDRADFPWRIYRPDGRLYEAPSTMCMAGRERRNADDGSIAVTSQFILVTSNWDDAIMVDDALC